jgi:hypothetical protein
MRGSAKIRFAAALKRSCFIRFHMATILVATFLCGLFLSKILLLLGVGAMAVRYPATVVLSYLCFFLFVKLWLLYVSRASYESPGNTLIDFVDIGPSTGGSGPGTAGEIPFGGGRFGGGGAGGTFEAAGEGAGAPQVAAEGAVPDGASGSAAETVGDAAFSIFDSEEAAALLILFGLLIAAVSGAAVYLVWEAPDILTEAAFQAFLASGLLRRARGMDSPGWTGSVFRASLPPFAIVLALSFLFAVVARTFHPEARTVVELYRILRSGD